LTPKQREKHEKKRMLSSHRYSYMFMVIALAFMLGIGDTMFWVNRTKIELSLFSFIREMNVINNIVNPFVYGFFDRHFRQETQKLLNICKCW